MYNEIIVLPFMGFNMYTKTELAKRRKIEDGEGDLLPKGHLNEDTNDMDYTAMSPHAGYDAKRMERTI